MQIYKIVHQGIREREIEIRDLLEWPELADGSYASEREDDQAVEANEIDITKRN